MKLDEIYGAGTAGVWRISALNEAGGWKDRTTVEDMDLAVRAGLKGWKFVYLSDLKVSLNHTPFNCMASRFFLALPMRGICPMFLQGMNLI